MKSAQSAGFGFLWFPPPLFFILFSLFFDLDLRLKHTNGPMREKIEHKNLAVEECVKGSLAHYKSSKFTANLAMLLESA